MFHFTPSQFSPVSDNFKLNTSVPYEQVINTGESNGFMSLSVSHQIGSSDTIFKGITKKRKKKNPLSQQKPQTNPKKKNFK